MPSTQDIPPVHALNNTLLWPFSLQAQGNLFKLRGNDKKSPSDWLRGYADHIEKESAGTWRRVANPLGEYFGVPRQYQPEQQYAEVVYFHQFFRKLFYETDPRRRAMEVLVREDVAFLDLAISYGDPSKNPPKDIRLKVLRTQLFLFPTDLAILAVELEAPADPPIDFSLALDLLNQVRRFYPPYFSLSKACIPTEDHPVSAQFLDTSGAPLGPQSKDFQKASELIQSVHQSAQLPISPHWAWLLQPLTPWQEVAQSEVAQDTSEDRARERRPNKLCFDQLGDERAHSMVRIALPEPHKLRTFNMYRLAYLDHSAGGFAYNPDFLKQQAAKIFYDRFWQKQTRWMSTRFCTTPYSFIMLTSTYQLNESGGLGPILLGHFRHHYFLLNLLAVMQRGSLLIFWDRLSNLLRNYSTEGDNRQEFHINQRWLSEDFAGFWARFEFSEASNQLQPLELFDMLRNNMRIEQLSNDVSRQMQFAREIEEGHYQEGLTRIATLWIPASLAFGFLGFSYGFDDLWTWSKTGGGPIWEPVRRFFFICIPVVCASWLLFKLVNKFARKLPGLRHFD